MAASQILRAASRTRAVSPFVRFASSPISRTSLRVPLQTGTSPASLFSTTARRSSGAHDDETFEEFNLRYEKEFDKVQDVFELQRNLNNSFAYDLVPSTSVITAALRAARRVNDFPTAVRIFEAVQVKVENKAQYEQYLEELEPLRKELGVELKETLYPGVPVIP